MKRYTVDVTYYPDEKCFVGTSQVIPGLVLEAGSIKEFIDEAKDIVPHLLEMNLGVSRDEDVEIFVALETDDKLAIRANRTRFCFSDGFIEPVVQEDNAIPVR